MNEFLADLYGTAETIGAESDDTTKLAQAEIMSEMFQAEGIDVDELAPDTIVKVAESLFGDENEIGYEDVAEDEDEASEKLAEADFLGRVMAHSYVDEMDEIEKSAGKVRSAWEGVKGVASKAKARAKLTGERLSPKNTKFRYDLARMEGKAVPGHPGIKPTGRIRSAVGALNPTQRKALAAIGATGLAGAGGYAGYKKMKKQSALDVLAEQRAMEMLEYGGGEDKLASAVEERALEMLYEAGYLE